SRFAEGARRAMTRGRPRRWPFSYAAALAAFACSEERVALLDPVRAAGAGTRAILDAGATGYPDAAGLNPDAAGLFTSACNRWSAEREPESALMMWVVDVSGTMLYGIQGSSRSKWDVERSVMSDAVGWLAANVGLGVLYFPNMATPASSTSRPAS